MTNAEQMLVELVTRIDGTNFTRCHAVRDFQGWYDSFKRRHRITEPDWIQEIQDVDFLDDDADDEFIAEILDEVEPDDVLFEGDQE